MHCHQGRVSARTPTSTEISIERVKRSPPQVADSLELHPCLRHTSPHVGYTPCPLEELDYGTVFLGDFIVACHDAHTIGL